MFVIVTLNLVLYKLLRVLCVNIKPAALSAMQSSHKPHPLKRGRKSGTISVSDSESCTVVNFHKPYNIPCILGFSTRREARENLFTPP